MNADAQISWGFVCGFPLLLAVVLAVLGVLALRRSARRRLTPLATSPGDATTPPPRRFAQRLTIALIAIGGGLFLLYQLRSGRAITRQDPWSAVNNGVVWVVGVVALGMLLPFALPRVWARYKAARERHWQPKPPTPGDGITILHALFTRIGLATVLGGAILSGLFWLLLDNAVLGVVFGGVFAFVVLALHSSHMKAAAGWTATTPAPFVPVTTPVAAGSCPTCFHPIPPGSPLGLCPRCLIRGAMPSPTATRWRGVAPIEPPSPAEVGEFFPHLEVLELIGAGGMGAVYRARQPHLDRVVALKIVQSPRGDEDPVFAERFAREARAMAKLDHPNIVTIHESGEVSGLPFLVMEHVDGVTLREAMVNRLLTLAEAMAVLPQVCDALDYAHANGVVHRDIKPENILIDQSGRVKIADFGLAKLADPQNITLTRTQQAMGTPHYMAPEQWEKPNEVDHRADVYALGVVLYELLTGELPLGRFDLPSQKGKGDSRTDEVVVRALAKEPGQRFQSAGEMKQALGGVNPRWAQPLPSGRPRRRGFEFKSKATLLGWPLVHVVAGRHPTTGRMRIAKGWIAVGDVMAVGGIAVSGVMSVGVVAVGGVLGLGLLGFGGAVAVGLLAAVGGSAAGVLFALGGNAASLGLSIGGLAAGKFAIGGEATGEFVITEATATPGFGDALLSWVNGLRPF